MTRRALITGITGQDGSYLAELLLAKGYEVHGIVRRVALEDPAHRMARIQHLLGRITVHAASLESFASVFQVLTAAQPDECYHLAGQSYVAHAFGDELETLTTNIAATHSLLAAVYSVVPRCRFYFAASSEMFGNAAEAPQSETTPFLPRSAYGISKVAGYHLTRNYRELHGMHASSGLMYNHESPRRGFEFVTRKITSQVARIRFGLGLGKPVDATTPGLTLGSLDARRDWGHARDAVRAMWLMLQQEVPDDYVIATGESRTVADFAAAAFAEVGLDWRDHTTVDPRFVRPPEAQVLYGDARKAARVLGWFPTITFGELVREMVQSDLASLAPGAARELS